MLHTDPDASVRSNDLGNWFAQNRIKNVLTWQHGAIAERAIRTIRKRLNDKLKDDDVYPDGSDRSYWTAHIGEIVELYNKANV